MNSFQRKSLYAALAGVGALGVTGTADAVNVNPNSLGQVLIYPYYTVNTDGRGNAFNSLISVVNSTNSAKAVKVRFLEGKDSREVLDFNLFLSKPTTCGPRRSSRARLPLAGACLRPTNPARSRRTRCCRRASTLSISRTPAVLRTEPIPDLDRTKEGYVEMIEMATFSTFTCTYQDITHIAAFRRTVRVLATPRRSPIRAARRAGFLEPCRSSTSTAVGTTTRTRWRCNGSIPSTVEITSSPTAFRPS